MGPTGILYLNNAPFVGGAQITLRAIIQRLDRSRFRPYLALPEGQQAVVRFFEPANAPITLVPMPPLNPPSLAGLQGLAPP